VALSLSKYHRGFDTMKLPSRIPQDPSSEPAFGAIECSIPYEEMEHDALAVWAVGKR